MFNTLWSQFEKHSMKLAGGIVGLNAVWLGLLASGLTLPIWFSAGGSVILAVAQLWVARKPQKRVADYDPTKYDLVAKEPELENVIQRY